MATTFEFENEESLTSELHSESTLPLLTYLVRCKQSNHNGTGILFQDVKSNIGEADRPIPDESVELKKILLKLIEKGPSGDHKRIHGNPTVSCRCYHIPRSY